MHSNNSEKCIKISAIVVLYHSKHLIDRLIKNITEKIEGLNEIILVDNSNEDLTEFESSCVKVIHPDENIGYGAAINAGVKAVKNDFIVALNPDIKITAWRYPDNLTSHNLMLLSGKPKEWDTIRKFPTLWYDILRLAFQNLARPFRWIACLSAKINLQDIHEPVPVDWISGALIITNKKTMTELGGFDKNYFLFYEEVDLCKRASLKSIPRYILPTITFDLNQGTASSIDVNYIKIISEIASTQRYHKKYSGKFTTAICFTILKIYCLLILFFFSMAGYFSNSEKLRKKTKQYRHYYQNL